MRHLPTAMRPGEARLGIPAWDRTRNTTLSEGARGEKRLSFAIRTEIGHVHVMRMRPGCRNSPAVREQPQFQGAIEGTDR